MSGSGSNMTLTELLGRNHNLPSSISLSVATKDADQAVDSRSRKGQFGWFTLGNSHLPFIYRNDDQEFCSVRMAECSALNSYLKFLNKDIFNYINIESFNVTATEADLLNQINFIHSNGQFGRDQFSRDLLVKVSDVQEFYNFLSACYAKLSGKTSKTDGVDRSRLGFVIINKESVVPYTISKGRKYVPLFYFEGEVDQLKLVAHKLEGWDLCYLKFCCKIQGIRNQLVAHDTCSVVDMDDIKSYFPPDTTFEEYWPSKPVDMQMLITTVTAKSPSNLGGGWTKPAKAQPSIDQQLTIIPKPVNSQPVYSYEPRNLTRTYPTVNGNGSPNLYSYLNTQ